MISVVIPLHNKERSINTTLKSVCNQSYTDDEIIVIDDGSTDNSAQFASAYPDTRIRVIKKMNGGVCSARNRGIVEAKGDYIALLDADDVWDMEYLNEQVRMIYDFPDAVMWSINFAETNNGIITRRYETGLPDGYRGYVKNYFNIPGRVSDLFHPSSVVIRKEVFSKVGMFDERIKYSEDSDMWFRINAVYKTAFYDKILVSYQQDTENRAMNKTRRLKDWLPYYVDKFNTPLYRKNIVFYRWINRWCAGRIRNSYFSKNKQDYSDAKVAIDKLDFSMLPYKYKLFFRMPYIIAQIIYKIDCLRMSWK